MARNEEGDRLRGCPTCGTKVDEAKLGLRDYSGWLSDILPGRVSASDIDAVVEQSSTGRVLFIEFKRPGERLPTGQRLLLRAMRRKGIDVWVVWGDEADVQAGEMDTSGEVQFVEKLTKKQLSLKARRWWYVGIDELERTQAERAS